MGQPTPFPFLLTCRKGPSQRICTGTLGALTRAQHIVQHRAQFSLCQAQRMAG